ncbi:MAG TPA: FtsX-like permease family protein [Thermoanaerobaculia bacterium]|jgi:putative ABC transport system permease protein|nr:FtsX-like permease family protein [Thermoanaerobaculia bacterium]
MGRNRARFAVIVLEIAITLAIVTNCLNIILDQRKGMSKRSGFDDDNLVWVGTAPFGTEWKDQSFVEKAVHADLRALQAMPGVKNAAATYFLPWQGGGSSGTYRTDGFDGKFQAQIYPTTPEIFDTLGVHIVAGRGFVPTDTPTDPNSPSRVTVISSGLAKKLWGSANPLGKVIASGEGKYPRTVIGVIGEFYNPYSWPIGDFVLFTPGRAWSPSGTSYLIRTEAGAKKAVLAELETGLLKVNPDRVFRTLSISEVKANFFSTSRIAISGMTGLIIALIVITALGIVGVTAMSVAERTKQIGTRRALGATRGDILRHFLAENWIATTAGLILGVMGTYGLNLFLLSRVSDVKMPWQLVAAGMLLLWINGLLSTIPPALRATMVPPSTATRSV